MRDSEERFDNSMGYIEIAQGLICDVLGIDEANQFVKDILAENDEAVAAVLKAALSTRTSENWPQGRRGTPTERYAAEQVLKMIDREHGITP